MALVSSARSGWSHPEQSSHSKDCRGFPGDMPGFKVRWKLLLHNMQRVHARHYQQVSNLPDLPQISWMMQQPTNSAIRYMPFDTAHLYVIFFYFGKKLVAFETAEPRYPGPDLKKTSNISKASANSRSTQPCNMWRHSCSVLVFS